MMRQNKVNWIVAIVVIALLVWMILDKGSRGYKPDEPHPLNLNPRDGD